MKKLKFLGVLLGLILLTGCGGKYSDSELNELVQSAMVNRLEVFAQEQEINFLLDYDAGDNAYAQFQTLNVNGNLAGYFFGKPGALPEIDSKLMVDFTAESNSETIGGAADLEIKVVEEKVYVLINKLPENLVAGLAPFLLELKDKWWYVVLPEEVLQTAQNDVSDEATEQVRTLISETEFFEDLKFVSEESKNGETIITMEGKFSSEGIKTYVNEVSVIAEAPLPGTQEQQEIDSLLKLLEEADITLSVTKDNPLITNMTFDFEASLAKVQSILLGGDSEIEAERLPEAEGEVKITLTLDSSNFGEEQDVEIPEGATEFIPEEVFGELPEEAVS